MDAESRGGSERLLCGGGIVPDDAPYAIVHDQRRPGGLDAAARLPLPGPLSQHRRRLRRSLPGAEHDTDVQRHGGGRLGRLRNPLAQRDALQPRRSSRRPPQGAPIHLGRTAHRLRGWVEECGGSVLRPGIGRGGLRRAGPLGGGPNDVPRRAGLGERDPAVRRRRLRRTRRLWRCRRPRHRTAGTPTSSGSAIGPPGRRTSEPQST